MREGHLMLLPEWKKILRKAWSVRLAIIAAALGGVEMALPLFSDAVPRHVFMSLSILTTVGAALARIVAQPKTMGTDK